MALHGHGLEHPARGRAGLHKPHADSERLPTPAIFLSVPWHLNAQNLRGHPKESRLGIDLWDLPLGVIFLALGRDGRQCLRQVLIIQLGQFALKESLGWQDLIVELVFRLFKSQSHGCEFGGRHLDGQVCDASLGVRSLFDFIGGFADEVGAAKPGDGHPHARALGLVGDLLGIEIQHICHVLLNFLGIRAHARE